VIPGCNDPLTVYRSLEDWLQHLKNHEELTQWVCSGCPGGIALGSQQAFVNHVTQVHSIGNDEASQLADLCKHTSLDSIQQCPLCGHVAPIDQPLIEHIADEVHEASILALPWADTVHNLDTKRVSVSASLCLAWLVRNDLLAYMEEAGRNAEDWSEEVSNTYLKSNQEAFTGSDMLQRIEWVVEVDIEPAGVWQPGFREWEDNPTIPTHGPTTNGCDTLARRIINEYIGHQRSTIQSTPVHNPSSYFDRHVYFAGSEAGSQSVNADSKHDSIASAKSDPDITRNQYHTVEVAIAVVGLFNDCVDIFKYIQIDKNFGRDAITYALLLMHVQLDFSRWGEAVGLKDLDTDLDPNDLDLASLAFPPEDLPRLQATLDHIVTLLKDSEEAAKKNTVESSDDVFIRDVNAITEAFHEISLARRNNWKGWSRKAQWSIHGRDEFKGLLDDLRDLISGLEKNFPPPNEKKLALVRQEIPKLNLSGQDLLALQRFLKEDSIIKDDLFKAAVDEAVAKQGGTITYNTAHSNEDNNKGQQIGYGGTVSVFHNNIQAGQSCPKAIFKLLLKVYSTARSTCS